MSEAEQKLHFDRELLDVYLTGLQAEVESKLRALTRFRQNMQRLDEPEDGSSKESREAAAHELIAQIETMLETNRVVRETLDEIRTAAGAVLDDLNTA